MKFYKIKTATVLLCGSKSMVLSWPRSRIQETEVRLSKINKDAYDNTTLEMEIWSEISESLHY